MKVTRQYRKSVEEALNNVVDFIEEHTKSQEYQKMEERIEKGLPIRSSVYLDALMLKNEFSTIDKMLQEEFFITINENGEITNLY